MLAHSLNSICLKSLSSIGLVDADEVRQIRSFATLG